MPFRYGYQSCREELSIQPGFLLTGERSLFTWLSLRSFSGQTCTPRGSLDRHLQKRGLDSRMLDRASLENQAIDLK